MKKQLQLATLLASLLSAGTVWADGPSSGFSQDNDNLSGTGVVSGAAIPADADPAVESGTVSGAAAVSGTGTASGTGTISGDAAVSGSETGGM